MVDRSYYLTAFDYDKKIPKLETPIDLVVVHQTDSNSCHNITDCIEIIKELHQYDHHHNKSPGIQHNDQKRFNFMIGGDGRVYEGLGYDYRGDSHHGKNLSK